MGVIPNPTRLSWSMGSRVVHFLCAVGFAGVGIFAASRVFLPTSNKAPTDTVAPLLEQVQSLGELHTVKFTYRDVHEFSTTEEPDLWIAALPGSQEIVHAATRNTALMSYTGTVEAGVDLGKAKVIRSLTGVEIQLPKPQVFPANVSAQVHDLSRGLVWRDVSIATSAIEDAKLRFRQTSIRQGIVAEAEKNAQLRVAKLASAISNQPVKISFSQT
jgi:hypothetical protein